MADTDLIASIYPFEDYTGSGQAVVRATENQLRLISTQPIATEDDTSPREHHGPGLASMFNQPPRSRNGFVCLDTVGTATSSSLPCLAHHFAVTFDEHYRLVVKDLDSANGTEVRFNGQGSGRLRYFSWVVGGDPISPFFHTEIVINVNEVLKF